MAAEGRDVPAMSEPFNTILEEIASELEQSRVVWSSPSYEHHAALIDRGEAGELGSDREAKHPVGQGDERQRADAEQRVARPHDRQHQPERDRIH